MGYGNQLNTAWDALPVANMVRQQELIRSVVPSISVTDSVNSIYVQGGTIFPATLSLSTTWDLDLYHEVISAIRDENTALGTHWVLSPELDLARDPRNGRVGEMYGEDNYLVGELASQYVRTMQTKDEYGIQVGCVIKHFLYGENLGGVNTASMYGGFNHLWNDLAKPFVRAIKEDPLALMVSYASIDQVPDHMNKKLLQGMLREEMGFKGLIMSDAGGIAHLHSQSLVASSYADAALKALEAGVQNELAPGPPACFPELLAYQNDSHVVELVNAAAWHMLYIKFTTGVFDRPLPSMENLNKTLRAPSHLEVNKRASGEAIVLLENDGILPLSGSKKIALIGPFANILDPGSYAPVSVPNSSVGQTLKAALESEYGVDNLTYLQGTEIVGSTNNTGIRQAASVAAEADIAIVNIGSLSVYVANAIYALRTDGEFFSHADLGFPGAQQELLDAVLATGTPTILVLSGGQSFILNNSSLSSNAILHTFLGGEATAPALVDILTGKTNPSGKLTITMPEAEGAFPYYYDYLPSDAQGGFSGADSICQSDAWTFPCLYRGGARHAFGYGLSYTTFDIAAPTLSTSGNDSVTISTTVKNTGAVVGKEVVQIYYRPQYTEIEFPVKKLIRFQKISLEAGESKDVSFQIPYADLGYYVYGQKVISSGNYTFWAGSSSQDWKLKNGTITISV